MPKSLKGECRRCGGQFEFPAEAVGTSADCPHCGKPTELMLAAPPPERAVPARTVIYTVIAILMLVGALVAAIIVLQRARQMSERLAPAPPADAPR